MAAPLTFDEKLARLGPNTIGTLAFMLIFGAMARVGATWKATGRSPLAVLRHGDAAERLRILGAAAWPFFLLADAAFPGLFPAPWRPLDNVPVKLLGILAVSLGFSVTASAYLALGEHFRIGADPDQKATLLTAGPYARIRHPVYSGLMLIQAGAFFLSPQSAFLVAFLLMLAGAWKQAEREERTLLASFGAEYERYLARTGRFLPKIG